jgi:hypothetical protein
LNAAQVAMVRGELDQAQRDHAMQVRGMDAQHNWIHVAPPTRNFSPADLELHRRIREDQSLALAAGATQELHTAY